MLYYLSPHATGHICASENQFADIRCCNPRGEPNVLQIRFLRLKDDDDPQG